MWTVGPPWESPPSSRVSTLPPLTSVNHRSSREPTQCHVVSGVTLSSSEVLHVSTVSPVVLPESLPWGSSRLLRPHGRYPFVGGFDEVTRIHNPRTTTRTFGSILRPLTRTHVHLDYSSQVSDPQSSHLGGSKGLGDLHSGLFLPGVPGVKTRKRPLPVLGKSAGPQCGLRALRTFGGTSFFTVNPSPSSRPRPPAEMNLFCFLGS